MEKKRFRRIAGLALPIIGGMISQNILNLVDTAMVGFLGDSALAAVGIGGFAMFMSMAIILGVSTGVQAMASRRKGERRFDETALPLNGGIFLVVLVGLPLSICLFFSVPSLFPFLNSDPEVIGLGSSYLQIRVLAIVFVGTNFAFRGFWNAVDLPRLYMSTLIIMHVSNVIMNYTLIFGKFGAPALGVTGAAIGTAASTAIGTTCYIYLGFKYARKNGFLKGLPPREELMRLIKLSLPNGVQQFFFAAGFTTLYWIIGKVGTTELAAANVLLNIMLTAILPGIALGLSAATLVGQALGRRDPDDALRWGWDVGKIGLLGIGVIGIPMIFIPDLILSGFIHEKATLDVARLPLQVTGFTVAIEGMGLILMNALLGAGDAKRVMIVSITLQWGLFLPVAYVLGPVLGFGLLAIWIAQGSYRIAQAIIFFFIWRKGRWANIRV